MGQYSTVKKMTFGKNWWLLEGGGISLGACVVTSTHKKKPKDKVGGKINQRDAKNFNTFLDSFYLLDFELEGANFTHNSRGSKSRLARFLISSSWIELFGAHSEKANTFALLDHKMIMYQESRTLGGPKPFYFELFG